MLRKENILQITEQEDGEVNAGELTQVKVEIMKSLKTVLKSQLNLKNFQTGA